MAEPFTPEDSINRSLHLISVHVQTLEKAASEYPSKIDLARLDENIRKLLDISHALKDQRSIVALAGRMGRVTNAPA